MLRSSFFGFTTALRGLNASQKSLDVTGQNISNLNTPGYTRQRLDLYSSPSGGYGDLYGSKTANKIGQGVVMGGVNQIRDQFLDVRFRRESSKLGETDKKLEILNDLNAIFDETTTDGLGAQMSDLLKQLQELSKQTGNSEFDGIVKASAEVLTKIFNQYSKQIDSVRENTVLEFDKVLVPDVNRMLENISKLNQNIKEDNVLGNKSLELTDQRNMLLDELSMYIPIEISYVPTQIAAGVTIDTLKVDLIMPGGGKNNINLIDGTNFGKFESSSTGDHTKLDFVTAGGVKMAGIEGNITGGAFKSQLDMLNLAGEFDNPSSAERGIGYYEQMLDLMAEKFATVMNEANKPADGSDKPLFATNDGTKKITAENLTLSQGWKNNDYGVTHTKENLPGNNSGARDNILYMISQFNGKNDYTIDDGKGGKKLIMKGSFQESITQTGNILALDYRSTTQMNKNYFSVLEGVADLRDGISAVNLDEEGVNLMRFQKSYNAAARLMTTLDEAIDTIINKLGIVGR